MAAAAAVNEPLGESFCFAELMTQGVEGTGERHVA